MWELQATLETWRNLDRAVSRPAALWKLEAAVVSQEETGSGHSGVIFRKQDPQEMVAD